MKAETAVEMRWGPPVCKTALKLPGRNPGGQVAPGSATDNYSKPSPI